TLVDTRMGAEILREKGFLNAMEFPVSEDPSAQHEFQLMSAERKHIELGELFRYIMMENCKGVFVYCNSLSASADFGRLSDESGLPAVTPLDVYRNIAPRFSKLAVIAANSQGLAGIEKVLYSANPQIEMMGTSIISAVHAIENGENPNSIVERLKLDELAEWYEHNGMEALVLGCTHFPYFKEALIKRISLSIIDPADDMIEILKKYL
ncbi:MAG: Asp/Glu/hydantoin racemase, partial [Clostridiales bacterium]|nr:Asp/Glu/hydantoin racemase [Clostridiales bacterium]